MGSQRRRSEVERRRRVLALFVRDRDVEGVGWRRR